MKKTAISLIAVVVAITNTDGAGAQTNTSSALRSEPALLFVMGNLEYILLHELAHLLIDDLDIPIFGSEESAADYIATGMLIRAGRSDAEGSERARRFLLATANGLVTSWDLFSTSTASVRYWDGHGLTIQRFYQMICLIYGSNQQEFGGLPARVGMPEARAARCPREFARADRSLDWLLENFGRGPEDPPGAEVEVVFEQAPTRVSERVSAELVASGMLDEAIRRFQTLFSSPESFRIAFRHCREAQAAWLPQEREITICYALVDAYYALGTTRSASRRQLELDAP